VDNNESYFRQKFNECGKHLNVQPSNLVSLKYREIRDHHYYTELLRHLEHIKGLNVKDIGNVLNGRAYLVSYGNQSIVFVEHETGLEILYVAGSIASLIGLVLQISSTITSQRRNLGPFPPHFEDIEIRYFDDSDKFIEEHRPDYLPYELFLLPQPENTEIELMKKRIANLEKKLGKLTKQQTKKKK